jgi:hypothetical protein
MSALPVKATEIADIALPIRWPGREQIRAHCRFAAMSVPEITIHTAILVIGVLGILVSLAGIVFWWVSRKMNRLT